MVRSTLARSTADAGADRMDRNASVRTKFALLIRVTPFAPAVYEYGCQVPSGVFSSGANRSRRRPRAPSRSPPCFPPEHFFPAALPSPQAGGGRRRGKNGPRLRPPAAGLAVRQGRKRLRSVGVRLGPGARPERPSIRGGPAPAPSTWYRIRLGRPARR